jgi:hypothetical protein
MMVAFITNGNTLKLYDAREESTAQVTTNLNNLLNGLNSPIVSGTTNVQLLTSINPNNIVFYRDLFVLYVRNSYLQISPSDMIQISSWLNNQWNSFLNSTFLNLFYELILFYS